MRILIVSDIHANAESLRALPQDYDEMWVLGDIVNYGPDPLAAIEFVRERASLVVRGNHDHAAGYGEDPRCSAPFRGMAEATGCFTASVLRESDKQFLRGLPLEARREVNGVRFLCCHAAPSDPLYEYCPPESERWAAEAQRAGADVVLTGHTHLPFQKTFGGTLVVNPGSLGQAKHGRPEACFAVWDGRSFHLDAWRYDVERTVEKIRALPVAEEIQQDLAAVLTGGGLTVSGGRSR